MDEITAVLLAGAIGALAGITGAAFGALGSVRASQLAARAPLADKIHALAQSIIQLRAAIGTSGFVSRLNDFNVAWNDAAVHQKLLAPSYRIASLNDLVFKAALQAQANPNEFVDLAGQALSVVTDMVAAHSSHLLRSRALRAEQRILNQWLGTQKSQVMSNDLRDIIKKLAGGKKLGPYGFLTNAWWRGVVESRSGRVALLLVLGMCLYIPIRLDRFPCGDPNISCGPRSGFQWVWESGYGAFDVRRWFMELVGVFVLVTLGQWAERWDPPRAVRWAIIGAALFALIAWVVHLLQQGLS